MTEMYRGLKTDGSNAREMTLSADSRLVWLQPSRRSALAHPMGHWSAVELELVDLHARYERACVED